MHVLTASQFTKREIDSLFQKTSEFKALDSQLATRKKLAERRIGRQLCSLFYEPSTRTRLSFETAAVKLGMGVVSTENAREFSSAAKGESIEDTIRVLDQYAYDVIVLRHHETGAAAQAAAVSKTPIINAGDGKGEHPTQALLDAYTIFQHHGRLDNLRVVLGGDLAHGRTVRSLVQFLAQYTGNSFVFVSTPQLRIGDDIKEVLRASKLQFTEVDRAEDALDAADVVYWTRLQKERLADASLAENNFQLRARTLETLPKNAIIMHPLPRVDEIHMEVDADPRAQYFQQAGNGLYVRMALLDQIVSLS